MSPRKLSTVTQLGNFVIRRRNNLGWLTADLARVAQLSYSTVRNIEKGYSRKPAEAILRSLSKALDCDAGVLFAYAGYGTIPTYTPEEIAVRLDELGDEAPLWRDTIEDVKRKMTPDQQRQALAVLRAQINAASRHW